MFSNEFITVSKKELITPRLCKLFLHREGYEPFVFIPGQFLNLFVPNLDSIYNDTLRRSYSIGSIGIPDSNFDKFSSTQVEIIASYVDKGVASKFLFEMKVGDKLMASSSFGRLILNQPLQSKRIFLIGTGTGIVPYRSMLKQIDHFLSDNDELSFFVICGAREKQDLLYNQDFLDMHTKYPDRFAYRVYYTKSSPVEKYEFQGRLQSFFAELQINANEDIFYLCGNPNMIDECYAILVKLGLDVGRIKREKYISGT